jgi:hypothetical protein
MFRATSITLAFLMGVLLGTSMVSVVDANAFLKASPKLREERISEEDVQASLLAEVEGTFGHGSASSRVKQLEAALSPIYASLPKNEKGYLGHASVHYALHRLFVQRHGWVIKGLDTSVGHRNATAGVGLLKEQVPAYIQDLFEQRLAGRGLGLHEVGVLAATIEHLVHSEAIKRLGDAFRVHNFVPTSLMTENDADNVLDTYMAAYIVSQDLSSMSLPQALALKAAMPAMYPGWNAVQKFVRSVRQNCTESEGTAAQKESGGLDFSLVARVADRIGEQFGPHQNQECIDMKASLVKIEESGTGRVRLSDFYKAALGGNLLFQEKASYLREIGALDESKPETPRVVITNYLISPTNCIASSSFYSVCCMDECEGLLGHLEREIAAPDATPTHIAALVAQLSSSTVAAPRKIPEALLDRLGEIATHHGGSVPLHGRLFSQWLHHAFPRECPYPHVTGTTNPKTADEWLESTGDDKHVATDEEMKAHIDSVQQLALTMETSVEQEEPAPLPWSPEEQLLIAQLEVPGLATQTGNSLRANMLIMLVLASMAAVMSGIVRNPTDLAGGSKLEKFMV